jgi:hypothetical protein
MFLKQDVANNLCPGNPSGLWNSRPEHQVYSKKYIRNKCHQEEKTVKHLNQRRAKHGHQRSSKRSCNKKHNC